MTNFKNFMNYAAKGLRNSGGGNSHRSGYVIDTGLTRVLSRIDTILPAFNKAVTQYMVALFFMLLTVGVGNAWGQYYKVRLQAVYESGSSNGKLFACADADPNCSVYQDDPSTITGWETNVFEVVLERDKWGLDVHYWATTTENAPYFVSWYKNAECTENVTFNNIHGNEYGTSYTHYSTPEEAAAADPVLILYARFSKCAPKTFYFRCTSLSDTNSPKRGSVNYAEYTGNCLVTDKIDNQNRTAYNGETSYDRSFDIVSYPFRGYRFTEWTIVSGEPSFVEGFDKYQSRSRINITSTSNSSANPTTVQVRANYEELSAKTLTLQKDKSKGSVTAKYESIIPVTGKTWYKMQTTNLTAFGVGETERTYNDMYSSDKVTLIATPATGYQFKGWYTVNAQGVKTWLSANATLVLENWDDDTYYAHFGVELADDDVFVVGESGCKTFAQALAIATSSSTNKTILVRKDCTIPAGNYTIPDGITLVVPYSADQGGATPSITRVGNNDIPTGAYRTLTLAEGAYLNVYGVIEVSGCQSGGSENSKGNVGHGRPGAPQYGLMVMNEGSKITLNDGAVFRAWGFVIGLGEIDARRGSMVKEQFQIMDWKGALNTKAMTDMPNKVLPITQYYIQNIESPTIYHPGAKLIGVAAINATYGQFGGINALDSAGIIGVKYSAEALSENPELKDDAAIFLMDNEDDSEDTWVRKWYDAEHDRQVYEVNNSAYLGSLVMKVKIGIMLLSMDSRLFVLPITNNFKIHLKSGNLFVTQDTEMLPGSEIEIEKKATLVINPNQKLYLDDAEQWGQYVYSQNDEFVYGSTIRYRPGGVSGRDISTQTSQGDAKLTIHGAVDVKGYLFTTEGGAAITSSVADAGTITFTNAAPAFSTSHYVEQVNSVAPNYVQIQCVSGLLSNESGGKYGAYSTTAETPAGKAFTFLDMDEDGKGEWISMSRLNCFHYDNYGVYYIKPQAYVPISNGAPNEENDHTYRDHYAGTNKIYIEVDCQWWEVEAVEGQPGVFHCIHPQNNTYYCYDADGEVWVEKKYNVYWLNYNGDTLKFTNKNGVEQDHYELKHGTMPQWNSENPTRQKDANYSYTFSGWKPELASVTDSVTYVAQYTATPRQFIITFKDASGVDIETKLCEYGTIPSPTAPITSGYEWDPAISTVTGNQVYQEEAIPAETPASYTITFKQWNDTTIQSGLVTSGSIPAAPANQTKEADALYSYTFAGWKAANGNTYAPADALPAATANAIYTATYNKADKTYTIKFYQENGSTQIGETQQVAYGEMPNVPAYSKEATDAKTFTLVWSPLVSAATQDQDYIATFTEQTRQYAVTWKNYDGTTIETNYVDYNDAAVYSGVTPTKPETETYVYTFNGWSTTPAAHVTANVEYTAQFTETEKATSLEVTSANPQTPAANGVVQATTVTITPNGSVDLSASNTKLMADDLILESDGSHSGQIIAGANSQVAVTNAYFDLKVDVQTHKWYSIAVPWHVNAETGISVNGRTLEFGKDFDILYYDGAARAANGANGSAWKYLEDTYGKGYRILQPGTLYMIGLMMDAPNGIRFKKTGGALLTSSVEVNKYTESTANDGKDANWNGIANPALFYAYLNEGGSAHVAQSYNPADDNYTEINLSTTPLVVGQPIFVQAPAAKTVVAYTSNTDYASHAPRRTAVEENAFYTLELTRDNQLQGRLFVATAEEKEDHYVIGQDVLKMGISKNKAQLWINRYDAKLCMNTQALTNGVAEYPLSIYAPANGEYTLHATPYTSDSDYTLYLTLDGHAIWNLSESPYTLTLSKGTATNYGLRISARAPQTATGTDEAIIDAKGETKKVLINDQVYIIRGNEVYTIDGRLVK